MLYGRRFMGVLGLVALVLCGCADRSETSQPPENVGAPPAATLVAMGSSAAVPRFEVRDTTSYECNLWIPPSIRSVEGQSAGLYIDGKRVAKIDPTTVVPVQGGLVFREMSEADEEGYFCPGATVLWRAGRSTPLHTILPMMPDGIDGVFASGSTLYYWAMPRQGRLYAARYDIRSGALDTLFLVDNEDLLPTEGYYTWESPRPLRHDVLFAPIPFRNGLLYAPRESEIWYVVPFDLSGVSTVAARAADAELHPHSELAPPPPPSPRAASAEGDFRGAGGRPGADPWVHDVTVSHGLITLASFPGTSLYGSGVRPILCRYNRPQGSLRFTASSACGGSREFEVSWMFDATLDAWIEQPVDGNARWVLQRLPPE